MPAVSASACVLMSPEGELLFERNAHARLPVASTTKIMTAILALEQCELTEKVRIDPACCLLEGSSMYLKAGEEYTVEELLLGLMLVSGNDAAMALALHVDGSEEAFARRMNEKCRELGMVDSSFRNPHGLPQEGHYASAYDMALLMHYAMENPDFARISGTRSCRIGQNSLLNHNKLLYLCEGITGGKTGYTMAAGRCLVSACEREGLPLVCVTLSAPRDWEDHQGLYQWAYENYRRVDLSRELQTKIPVISGTAATVSLRAEEGYLLCKKEEELRAELYLPRFVFAPVQAGEEGGSYRLWLGEELLGEGVLRYCDTVDSKKD